jgi:hypothetical protein
MKIRSGFVSNSSSSSFIVLGFYTDEEVDEKLLDEGDAHCVESPSRYVVGETLGRVEYDYLEPHTFSIKELIERANVVADKFDVPRDQVMLITCNGQH